jgi:hypothetical protein
VDSLEEFKGLVTTLEENDWLEETDKTGAELFWSPNPPLHCNLLVSLFVGQDSSFLTPGSFDGETFPNFICSTGGEALLVSGLAKFSILFILSFCSLQIDEGTKETVDACDM